MTGKQIPAILAQSQELTRMRVKSEMELNVLKKLKSNDVVKEALPKVAPKKDKNAPELPNIQVKPICLLVGYMNNLLTDEELANEGLKRDLELILKSIPSYMDIMLQ